MSRRCAWLNRIGLSDDLEWGPCLATGLAVEELARANRLPMVEQLLGQA